MISYAQNFEDVILERIFKDKESGFYVDIGACHPVYDSVTYHFYLKGWSGINVEPQPGLFSELEAIRERDTNLQICVGAREGRETLYITRDVGTSTLRQSIAENYRRDLNIKEELTVDVVSLDQIWSQHVGSRQVDFLKIDVEGFEQNVLSGADFSKVAPTILVIEATIPNSQELCYEQWEALILDYYEFFYFDGLNRFYSRKGYPLDKATVSTPPNVFDQFKVLPQVLLERANETLAIENQALKDQLQGSLAQLTLKDEALQDASSAYADLQSEDQNQHRQLEMAAKAVSDYQTETARVQRAYEALAIENQALKDQLQGSLAQLTLKDEALQDASSAYADLQSEDQNQHRQLEMAAKAVSDYQAETARVQRAYESLQAAFDTKEKDLLDALEFLRTKENALADASQAYIALQGKQLELQASLEASLQQIKQLKDVVRQKEAELVEASAAYEALHELFRAKEAELRLLQKHLENKNVALVDAAKAYQALKEEFDEKNREVGELHDRLSKEVQPKA
jgi:FkbM family methyltransferase